ncbi:MAG: oxygen-independent coproporphyrinogen III oxidase, partial [Gammaproteobacteria bacterium]|nr:oxygen-independent coproporphyrinogen III oxidase [Gammaproteobacteria bacterium]
ESARREGFKSISVDLIYGLPFQTVDSFAATLERIIEINPDRLSIFNYAHLPQLFKPQRRINEDELPSPLVKLDILKMTIDRLSAAGYVYIGMDHFAKPDDELAIAQQNNLLYRNFQGYATHADCDLIGLGITSIGTVGRSFAQNVKTMEEYIDRIDAGKLAVFRGVEIDDDDIIRRNAIMQLICHFDLKITEFESKNNIEFKSYFQDELIKLMDMKNDGLIELSDHDIRVTAKGRLLIRNICMVFDRYLKNPQKDQRYSKAI